MLTHIQVTTIAKVFEANTYSLVKRLKSSSSTGPQDQPVHPKLPSPPPPPPPPPNPSSNLNMNPSPIPFKVLVTGKTVVGCLLPTGSVVPSPTPSQLCAQSGMVAPLLVSLLYNPLLSLSLSLQSCGGMGGKGEGQGRRSWRGEASLYNLTVGHNRGKALVSKYRYIYNRHI